VKEGELPWKWFHESNKASDIFTAAKKAGKTTAAVFWPVTGSHPDIDYNIAEYWTQGPDDTLEAAFTRAGTSDEVLPIVTKNRDLIVGHERQHPWCDNFIVACACDMIRQFQPDLLMIHPANIDGYRHGYGLFNDHVTVGVEETDRFIGDLFAAMEDVGVVEETNFFLVSDHGQMEIKRIININAILQENGLIWLDREGQIADWKAYCLSGGMSALVYLKDSEDKAAYDKTYELLKKLRDEGIYGISEVFTTEEAQQKHRLGGPFRFVLESDGYTSFGDSPRRPLIKNFDVADYRYGRATHGYLPEKGPQPVLLARGPEIAEGVTIPKGYLVNEAPTFARALGIELADTDGRVVEEILK